MVLDLWGRDGGVVRPASGGRRLRGGATATPVLVGAVLDAVATVVLDLGAVFLVRGGGAATDGGLTAVVGTVDGSDGAPSSSERDRCSPSTPEIRSSTECGRSNGVTASTVVATPSCTGPGRMPAAPAPVTPATAIPSPAVAWTTVDAEASLATTAAMPSNRSIPTYRQDGEELESLSNPPGQPTRTAGSSA